MFFPQDAIYPCSFVLKPSWSTRDRSHRMGWWRNWLCAASHHPWLAWSRLVGNVERPREGETLKKNVEKRIKCVYPDLSLQILVEFSESKESRELDWELICYDYTIYKNEHVAFFSNLRMKSYKPRMARQSQKKELLKTLSPSIISCSPCRADWNFRITKNLSSLTGYQ